MTIPTRDVIAAIVASNPRDPWEVADAVLSLLASKSETPETAKYPLKATKEMLDAAEISWTRSYEYEPYRFEKMLNAALAVVTIPLAEGEQRGDRCAFEYQNGACDRARDHFAHARGNHAGHNFVSGEIPPVSPMPPLGDAAGSEDADLRALIEGEARRRYRLTNPTDKYGLQANAFRDGAAFALAAAPRESPLPSQPEPAFCEEHSAKWTDCGCTPPAGPAPSVELERCAYVFPKTKVFHRMKCGQTQAQHAVGGYDHDFTNEHGHVQCPDCNLWVTSLEGHRKVHSGECGCHAKSPVDTMVSAADAFEKMRAARDKFVDTPLAAYSNGALELAIIDFMDAVIASHPACEDRKAK